MSSSSRFNRVASHEDGFQRIAIALEVYAEQMGGTEDEDEARELLEGFQALRVGNFAGDVLDLFMRTVEILDEDDFAGGYAAGLYAATTALTVKPLVRR